MQIHESYYFYLGNKEPKAMFPVVSWSNLIECGSKIRHAKKSGTAKSKLSMPVYATGRASDTFGIKVFEQIFRYYPEPFCAYCKCYFSILGGTKALGLYQRIQIWQTSSVYCNLHRIKPKTLVALSGMEQ